MAAPASAVFTDPEVIIYRFPGVKDDGGPNFTGVATVFHCTNFSGTQETMRFVTRNAAGVLLARLVRGHTGKHANSTTRQRTAVLSRTRQDPHAHAPRADRTGHGEITGTTSWTCSRSVAPVQRGRGRKSRAIG